MQQSAMAFQSTLPRGERPGVADELTLNDRVSIHAPARGATKAAAPWPATRWFQSTLPRGERPASSLQSPVKEFQSTLPRGERPHAGEGRPHCYRFNPRSREGSDSARVNINRTRNACFNPRSREGSDARVKAYPWPARACFNPRSREGSDKRAAHAGPICEGFDPRSREGSDPPHLNALLALSKAADLREP